MSKWKSLLLGTAAILLTSGYAMAAPLIPNERSHSDGPQPDEQETGVIADVSQEARSITLVDGHRYKIPGWINFDRLTKGAMISIVYTPNPHHSSTEVKTVTVI